ncbi:hypothetical protein R1sor_027363 [Riccia sorocarpa]|uniref:Endonuclease/exonuclease/phosphatase domain-containing protein n=1 Tax=Riccia sorocarpa TaxID=122646 RepID=A0ABD3GE01_9MARC
MVEHHEDSIGRGEWVYHIRAVHHQRAQTMSDHVPVSLELVLKAEGARRKPRRSYFKLDFKKFMKAEVFEKMKITWHEHIKWAKEKRKQWTFALGRIRKLLMDVKEEEKRKEEEDKGLETRAEAARLRVQYDHSQEAREEFEEVVELARRREHEQAQQLRRNCKITWLKDGNAPSKYSSGII